jgi:16S rRNA (cytidine1402-2'-O)-methyltransferase
MPLEPGLYIVSTPIGNLADITLRAIEVLSKADVVACEDTRVSRTLLDTHGIRTRCISVHNYNEDSRFDFLKSEIAIGKSVALISDAGTPLISDPGYKLASRLRKAGFMVTAAPGPSAVLDALVLSGMPSYRFTFVGFVPPKPNEREQFLDGLKNSDATIIFFETARRLAPTLEAIASIFGERQVAIARELTKVYEDVRSGTAAELAEHYKSAPPKGEIVCLIHPAANTVAIDEGKVRKLMRKLLAHMSLPDASEIASDTLGIPKNGAYDIGLGMKKEAQ